MLKGVYSFLGNNSFTSQKNNKTYYKAKFIDTSGNQLECETSAPLQVPQFQACNIQVEISQGQYTKVVLISHELVK